MTSVRQVGYDGARALTDALEAELRGGGTVRISRVGASVRSAPWWLSGG